MLLHKAGIAFGSHTVTHPKLARLETSQIQFELMRSKELIENQVGEPAESFSYPYAFPEADKEFRLSFRGVLERCGYKNGVSTSIGMAKAGDDVFFLRRIPVNSSDDLPLYRAKLEGGYCWMHLLQYVSKVIAKSRLG
jgi:peptidoglycan/xylan/chitin deacetylase (PgdA/CDA1 family)